MQWRVALCASDGLSVYRIGPNDLYREGALQGGGDNGVFRAIWLDANTLVGAGNDDALLSQWDIRCGNMPVKSFITERTFLRRVPAQVPSLSLTAASRRIGTVFSLTTLPLEPTPTLALGEEEFIEFRDWRQPELTVCETQVHEDEVTHLLPHPTRRNLLYSASADGLVCELDPTETDVDDMLQASMNENSSIDSIAFCNASSTQLCTVTDSGSFSVWNPEAATQALHFRDVRQAFAAEQRPVNYVINATYLQNSDALMLCGGQSHTQSDSTVLHGVSLPQLAAHADTGSLASMHGGVNEMESWSIFGGHHVLVRDLYVLDEESSLMVSVGEDPRVCVWARSDEEHMVVADDDGLDAAMPPA